MHTDMSASHKWCPVCFVLSSFFPFLVSASVGHLLGCQRSECRSLQACFLVLGGCLLLCSADVLECV